MAMGDHLRRHRWSGGPSMEAILGPGGPSTATYFATDGPGDLFWGDHQWHDRCHAAVGPPPQLVPPDHLRQIMLP